MKRLSLLLLIAGLAIIFCDDSVFFEKLELVSPVGGEHVYHPTFVWSSAKKWHYLQVGFDEKFDSLAFEVTYGIPDTTYTPIDSFSEGFYFWRVKGKQEQEDEWGDWSEIDSFYVDSLHIEEVFTHLLLPPDADTIKFPTLVWNSLEDVIAYHLCVYKGEPEANQLVIERVQTDTFHIITDSLDPATYRWFVEPIVVNAKGYCLDTFRFVTYTLDESFFPIGPNYVWEYMRLSWSWSGGKNRGYPDTSYYTVEVEDFISYGDSIYVTVSKGWQDIYSPFLYRNDTLYFQNNRSIRLFPEDGDTLAVFTVNKESDSTFWVGDKPQGVGEAGEDGWWFMYRQKGRGLIFFSDGYEVRYHGDPTQSHGWNIEDTLLNLDKGG